MQEKLGKIMEKMETIKYGFSDKDKKIYTDSDINWNKHFTEKYLLQSPKQLITTKYGVCWDQVELERYYLEEEKIKCTSYFMVNYDGEIFPTHTFIIVTANKKYYWFEHSWEPNKGIYEYDSLNMALTDIKEKFNVMIKNKFGIVSNDTIIYSYEKPPYNINANEFFAYCEKGKQIEV